MRNYHIAPTAAELVQYPILAAAWAEYLLIRKLTLNNDGEYKSSPYRSARNSLHCDKPAKYR